MKDYTPQTYINESYVELIKDKWIRNEFVYKNNNLVSLSIHNLIFNPTLNKPSFKLINLSDEIYLELYLPFVEIKHTFVLNDIDNKRHNVVATKYIKCNKYIKSNSLDSDLICCINENGYNKTDYILHNRIAFNQNNSIDLQELQTNNHYKFSHSYYKPEHYEPLFNYYSQVILIDTNNILINIWDDFDEYYDMEYVIPLPVQYEMRLDFDLYTSLIN